MPSEVHLPSDQVMIRVSRALAELLEAEPMPFHGLIRARRNDDGAWVLIFWEPLRDETAVLGT